MLFLNEHFKYIYKNIQFKATKTKRSPRSTMDIVFKLFFLDISLSFIEA